MDPEERVAAAERAVLPWWHRSMVAGLVLAVIVAAATLWYLVRLIRFATDDVDGYTTSTVSVVLVSALAAVTLVLVLALVLIRRRRPAGPILLTVGAVGVALAAFSVLAALLDSGFGDDWPVSVPTGLVLLVAVAATVVGAATVGRNLRVGRARDRVGLRTF